ncbi:calcium-binding protein [Microcoleus sp. ARI1-B5]|uniref:calcium-binding protein n=1 Tax=unclassified Microcoleus TaxID=2642155 RepID=UPI002FD77951
MALQPDPSEVRRLIGDNTSEFVTLSIADATNFPVGVWMLAGNDTVNGSTANDLVYGNEGEDLLRDNLGNDFLLGGKGKDFLAGGEGNDSLSGGQDADVLSGSAGNDILFGGRGNDVLFSGDGNDTLVGGLGRDILGSFDNSNTSIKIGGSNLYVLQAEPGVTDVNNADAIGPFRVGLDRIGLAGGLTASDVDLQYVTNVAILLDFDVPEVLKDFAPPGALDSRFVQSQGTLIKVRNSGDIVGFVENVRVADIQGSIISVQGF